MMSPDDANGADVPVPLEGFLVAHQSPSKTGYGVATDGMPHAFNAGDEVFNAIYLPALSAGTISLHYLEAGASNAADTEKLIVATNSPIDITSWAGGNGWPDAADFSVTLQTGGTRRLIHQLGRSSPPLAAIHPLLQYLFHSVRPPAGMI